MYFINEMVLLIECVLLMGSINRIYSINKINFINRMYSAYEMDSIKILIECILSTLIYYMNIYVIIKCLDFHIHIHNIYSVYVYIYVHFDRIYSINLDILCER